MNQLKEAREFREVKGDKEVKEVRTNGQLVIPTDGQRLSVGFLRTWRDVYSYRNQ